MFEETPITLSPVNFFQISADCCYLPQTKKTFPLLTPQNYQKYLLPNTSALCSQEYFADVALGWNQEGIEAFISIKRQYQQSYYPEVAAGDSVELFFDTRDVKTSGNNTRFCHHFFFLPESVEGHFAGEMTRFRTEDTHELCDAHELKVKAQLKENGYIMQIFIPSQCLVGYDPDQFDRLGFTYRINRSVGDAQHFSVTSDDYQLEQQPSLWSSLRLVK
jgi:hypothetical protein